MSQRDDDTASNGTCIDGRGSSWPDDTAARGVSKKMALRNLIKERKATSTGYATELREIRELEFRLQNMEPKQEDTSPHGALYVRDCFYKNTKETQ